MAKADKKQTLKYAECNKASKIFSISIKRNREVILSNLSNTIQIIINVPFSFTEFIQMSSIFLWRFGCIIRLFNMLQSNAYYLHKFIHNAKLFAIWL